MKMNESFDFNKFGFMDSISYDAYESNVYYLPTSRIEKKSKKVQKIEKSTYVKLLKLLKKFDLYE